MKIAHYEAIHKEKIEYQIKARYRKEIAVLQPLGFTELHFAREVTFPFSCVLMFWVYPLMKARGEIFRVESPLRYVLFNPLLLNFEYDSYCHIFGMGTKFVTRFVDGTALISCTYPTTCYEKPQMKIYKYCPTFGNGEIAVVWEAHQERILVMERKGRETDNALTLEKFEEMMARDDRAMIGLGR